MVRKMIARMMALILMVNLVLCVPLRVAAEGFDADPVAIDREEHTVTVTETATEVTTSGTEGDTTGGTEGDTTEQIVSVEIPLDTVLSQEPAEGSEPTVAADNAAIEYDTVDDTVPAVTVPVEEAFDLTAEITKTETDDDGNLTDITYEVSLDQKTTTTDDTEPTVETIQDVDKTWNQEASETGSVPPAIKVNLSVNGMDDAPTRVEHKYTDESGKEQTEYYYNAKQVEKGSDKKTFTVTVKEVAEAVTEKVVSLWTNFLGIFHITNDAFENQKDMTTSANLADAVNSAANGSTVEMLRDYTTDESAVLSNYGNTGDDVTVDFNQHTYKHTCEYTGRWDENDAAVHVVGGGQSVQFQNGTIDSDGDGIYIWYDDNTLTLDHAAIDANGYYGIVSRADSEDNSCNATVNIQNNSDVNSNWYGMYMYGNSNALNVEESNISGSSYGIMVYDTGSKVMLSGSKVSGDVAGIYSSGTSQSMEVKENSSITTSGTGINIWGTQNSCTIEKSTINYGSYGVKLNDSSNTLNVKNSTIGNSNLSGSYGILTYGSGQQVNLSGSTVNASKMGLYANGSAHKLEVKDKSTINASLYGIEILKAPKSQLLFQDSVINAGSYGVYAGAYNESGLNSGEYSFVIKGSVINANAADGCGVDVYGNDNTVKISDTTINAQKLGLWDWGKRNTWTIDNSKINYKGDFGITHNGNDGGANFEVTNTTIDPGGTGAVGIYISGSSATASREGEGLNKLILVNSEVTGNKSAVEVKFTDVEIDSSTLVSLSETSGYVANNNGTTTSGAALAVTDNTGDSKTGGTIIINSGKFYGHKDIDNIYQSVKETTGDDKATIIILGGRYVNTSGLYQFIPEGYATISHNDSSEYPYEVVAKGYVPARSGYVFMGYKDINGNDITLKEAFTEKIVAYAQWELAPESTVEAPKAEENDKNNAIIIVEPDSKGNNVDVTIQGSTAQVTVSTPAGEAAAVSEVTITSVERLRGQGVETVSVQVEENVTLELGVAKDADNGLGDTIVITRNEDTLVISSGEETYITIHMEALKAASTEAVHIRSNEGVFTVSFGGTVVFRMEVLEALRANKDLTVKLEGKILKLYDKDNNLIQQIPM